MALETFKVGVSGALHVKTQRNEAIALLKTAYDELSLKNQNIEVVSGLTALGIPLLAYILAVKRGYYTTGIACIKVKEHEVFKVDKTIIKDEWGEWGDESFYYLKYIDALVTIGGGKQTIAEINAFKLRYPHKPLKVFTLSTSK